MFRLLFPCACFFVLAGGLNADSKDADGVEPATNVLLDAAFDDYNRLHFDQAELEIRQAEALQPGLPVTGLYLEDALSTEIHELCVAHARDSAVEARFADATLKTIPTVDAWELAHHDARAQLYLGTSLGESGLVALSEGNYPAAYGFGKKANAALILAKSRDPNLMGIYLGLGDYQFFCGNLNGLLRFFLNLHGDVHDGIALIQLCGANPGRGSFPARQQLAWILTEKTRDYEKALGYVQELQARYPENWTNEKLALDEAQGLGLGRSEARELVESVCAQWDSGWRPPSYAHVNPGTIRLALAKTYVQEKRLADARRHLAALSMDDTGTAKEASIMIAGLGPASPAMH